MNELQALGHFLDYCNRNAHDENVQRYFTQGQQEILNSSSERFSECVDGGGVIRELGYEVVTPINTQYNDAAAGYVKEENSEVFQEEVKIEDKKCSKPYLHIFTIVVLSAALIAGLIGVHYAYIQFYPKIGGSVSLSEFYSIMAGAFSIYILASTPIGYIILDLVEQVKAMKKEKRDNF